MNNQPLQPPTPSTQVWRHSEASSVLEAIRREITLFVCQDFHGSVLMRILDGYAFVAVTAEVTEMGYFCDKFRIELVIACLEQYIEIPNSAAMRLRQLFRQCQRSSDQFTRFEVEQKLGWNGEEVREE